MGMPVCIYVCIYVFALNIGLALEPRNYRDETKEHKYTNIELILHHVFSHAFDACKNRFWQL